MNQFLSQFSNFFWPPCCLLCSNASQKHWDLCNECAEELPKNHSFCAICALPLPKKNAQTDVTCAQCQKTNPVFSKTYAPYLYDIPCDFMVKALKYQGRMAFARLMAQLMVDKLPKSMRDTVDKILPVPLHSARLRERGFNQAAEIANIIARATQLPMCRKGITRHKPTLPQSALPYPVRTKNVRGAFTATRSFAHERIAIVDDVMTTGATHRSLAKTLQQAGAADVQVWVFARTPKH